MLSLSAVIFILALAGLLYAIWFLKIKKARKPQLRSFGTIEVTTIVMFIIAFFFGINAIVYWLFDIGILILIGQIVYLFQFLPIWVVAFLPIWEPTIWATLPLIIAYGFLVTLRFSKE